MKKTPLLALALVAVGCGPPEPPTEPPPDGPFEEYHDNGQLESKGTYKDGEPEDGLFESHDENGQLWLRGTFKDGEFDGPYERYDDDGQLVQKLTYKDGKLHGPVEIRGTYNNDERCGEWFEDGETVTYDPCPPDLEDET